LKNLVAFVKKSGLLSQTFADEVRALERRLAELDRAERPVALPPAVDQERLRRLLREWRKRMRTEMPIARQMLRVLFPARIAFTPDAEQRNVELRGDCAVGNVFERLLVPQTVVAPTGFEPVFQP
jgi:hypothetical protein